MPHSFGRKYYKNKYDLENSFQKNWTKWDIENKRNITKKKK